ncbi:hypothetical protein HID58_090894 [Brassica napus]|uniref:Uncharacterized protein n=1 Tax=Brassica napus TaxID=3708 RepID=A0ABQ7X8D6_BRANA|nr:hypothetical protein HID58_090894 [Brassica napus]
MTSIWFLKTRSLSMIWWVRQVTVKVKNSLSSKQMKQVIDELDRAVMKMKKGEVALDKPRVRFKVAVCLMIWLRAVRQSGEASASFVNSGGTRAIVRASGGALGSFRGFSWRHLLRKLVLSLSDRKSVKKKMRSLS